MLILSNLPTITFFNMTLKILFGASLLSFLLGNVDGTPCHELQLTQLKSLNERMNQMIETISSLLPKSLKKLTPPATPTPTPSFDYLPSRTAHEMSYYPPPTYSIPPPVQHVMYVPSYAAVPTDMRLPRHCNPMMTPQVHVQPEVGPQREYSSMMSPFLPQTPRLSYEQTPQYISPMPPPNISPILYPPGPYSLIQSPYPTEYMNPNPFGYPLPAITQPNLSAYMPGVPFLPMPVQMPPGSYMPTYPQVSELPQKYT